MKKFEVVKNYLVDRGHGWEGHALYDEVEEFKAQTQKEAINYFRNTYGPIRNIWTNNFYLKHGKTINVYELHIVPADDDEYGDTNVIATAVIE